LSTREIAPEVTLELYDQVLLETTAGKR